VDEAAQLKGQLQSVTARLNVQLADAGATAKKINDEKRKFAMLRKELEVLKGELAKETLEHETRMKELTKIDNLVLSQIGIEKF
jgi:small nuclear ribonucleoprotein (snRNP)-like protein